MNKFDIDLQFGQIGEKAVAEMLCGPSAWPDHATIEVKRDNRVHLTGNLYVEYEFRGNKSGLNVTEADWWAFTVPFYNDKVILFVQTKFLREKLRDLWKHKWLGEIPGGDGKQAKGVLVPIQELFLDRQEVDKPEKYDEAEEGL